MTIDIEGLGGDQLLRRRIIARMGKVLAGLDRLPGTTLVNFTDINGARGGVDKRCGLTVPVPGRRIVHVEETATSQALAFSAAADVLERTLRKEEQRTDAARRRPRKYYVAERLMMPEPAHLAPEGPPSPRRRRRRAS